MSDISIEFTWYELIIVALFFGWPGLLLGSVIGAVALRRHRFYGGAFGAALGFALCLGVQFLWR
jgi:hypothetical protein